MTTNEGEKRKKREKDNIHTKKMPSNDTNSGSKNECAKDEKNEMPNERENRLKV